MQVKSLLCRCLALILVLSTLFLYSCKSNENREVVIPNPTQQPSNNKDSAAHTVSGELRLPIPENAIKTNPYSITTEEMQTMYSLIFESLITIDNNGKLVPSLAQSWTKSDTSSTTWIMNLRSNVKWHDGTVFNAYDVTFSYSTVKNYLSDSASSQYYANIISDIVSITAKEDFVIEVQMRTGGISALYSLNFPIICKNTWQTNPQNGTGPYKVANSTDSSVTLNINELWWRTSPNIKTIYFEERLNNDTALASYEAGQLNFVPSSNLAAGRYRHEGITNVLDIMTQNAELLLFNFNNTLLLDTNIRTAIACAINQSQIITNIYMNKAQACDVPIAPDSWLYDSKSKVIEYNIEKACGILENAGYIDSNNDGIREKDGNLTRKLSFTLLVNESTDNTSRKSAAEMIKEELAQCGIEIIIEAENFVITDSTSKYIERLQNGEFDIALTGVNLNINCNLSEFFIANGTLNFGNIYDEELIQLTSTINTAEDDAAMRTAAHDFQNAFVEKLPFIVLYFRLNSIVYSNSIKGLKSVREPDIMYSMDSWYINQ